MRRLLVLTLALLLWPTLAAAQPRSTERIEAELVSMSAWATPGSTLMLAVRQDIEPGWHTYWRNPGDSGGATTLDWRLPAGFSAGEIVWPLPERQRLGELMNYGYSGVVYLPVPVQVPADAAPGSRQTFVVTALFLVCSAEMCVPDELGLSLALPVAQGAAADTEHAGAIRRVLETSPRPAPITARVTLGENGRPVLTAAGSELSGVTRAYFFPFEGGILDHAAVQTGVRGSEGLTLTLTAGRGFGPEARPLTGVLDTDRGAFEITAEPGEALPGTSGSGALADGAGPGGRPVGVLTALGLALIGGLILNLMPCVFPVLAMKAASLASAAHDAPRARRDGLAFLAGVLVAFLALGGALLALRAAGQAVGWGFQLQSPGVMAGLTLLTLGVGLNLSGVYHVGAGLQSVAGSGPLSRLPGGVGAFFTGVLAVVVAAPCTAPFMAFALGAALVMPWPLALLIFFVLGLGLALPYVVASFSPALLRRLPRPGPWMERLKGVLAFPMYGTALWLAWVFSRQMGAEALALLFAAALLVAFGLWLAGLNQSARAEGRPAVLTAVAATLALLGAFGLAGTAAMLPAPVPGAGGATSASALPSRPWSAEAVAAARAEGRPVLVNFTADWCVTCKINERAALASGRVAEALDAANAVYLVGDWTRRDDVIAAELTRHGRSGVPLYLLYPAGGGEPRILPQLLTEGTILRALQETSAR